MLIFRRPLKAELSKKPLSMPIGFSTIYEQTHLTVFRYLFGLTGGQQTDAEDLTAETYLRAWKARESYRGEESEVVGWLLKIARRLAIDEYRRRRARPETKDEESFEPASAGPGPEEAALDREDRAILLRMLRSLPDEPREMLVLRYLLGWQVRQIAVHLDVSENSVSVAIKRSLERLRQEWPQPQEK
jgi:RNA polymerase sigma-70 factor (ECF subfamily)